jgi:hypothetical protein
MDTLTQLRAIIAKYSDQIDLSQQDIYEIIAIESFKLGANAGKLHEKAIVNEKSALVKQGIEHRQVK